MNSTLQHARRDISRRALTRGAAWSVPLLAVSASIPAMAASRPVGLNGWVDLIKSCRTNPDTIEIDGIGTFTGGGDSDRGIWVFANSTDQLANAYITFYISSNVTPVVWTAASGNSMWSVPTSTPPAPYNAAPAKTGYTAYTTVYSGTFTWNATYQAFVAAGQPHFTGVTKSTNCSTITSYAFRSVTVNNQIITFTRGPITL